LTAILRIVRLRLLLKKFKDYGRGSRANLLDMQSCRRGIVYNLLPPEIVNSKPRKELEDIPTFLYVGGDSYVKGFHILLQTLNKLGKQGIKVRFILTNRYSPRNLEMLKRLGEKYRNLEIQVVGRVDYEELLGIHKKVWALIFPSIWEELIPYAVSEASISGTIPIASAVGGVPKLLGGTLA